MRHKRIRDIVIELTSLLDVVMILIFAVMIENAKLVETKGQEVAELEQKNATMQEKLEAYAGMDEELAAALGKLEEGDLETILEKLHNAQNELESYEYMDDIVIVYNVGLENRYNNTARCLTYGRASGEKEKTYNAKRDTAEWKVAIDSLKVDLKEYIDEDLNDNKGDKYIYLVFSVDKTKVYANDYKDVEDALKKYENERIRYRLNILGEE